MEYFKNNFTAE